MKWAIYWGKHWRVFLSSSESFHRTLESWAWVHCWFYMALCMTLGIGQQNVSNIGGLHTLFTTKCISISMGMLSSAIFCQCAKLQFPVTASTCRCPSPVNTLRCNRMRNLSQLPQDGMGRIEGAELGKLHLGRGESQVLVTTVSGILYKLPHGSSPSCHTRTVSCDMQGLPLHLTSWSLCP